MGMGGMDGMDGMDGLEGMEGAGDADAPPLETDAPSMVDKIKEAGKNAWAWGKSLFSGDDSAKKAGDGSTLHSPHGSWPADPSLDTASKAPLEANARPCKARPRVHTSGQPSIGGG